MDKLFFTFVELPKFTSQLKEEGRKLAELTLEEKWYYFLSHASRTSEAELDVLSASLEIKEAYRALDYFSLNDAEVLTYEQAEKAMRDERAIREYSIKEAAQKGIEIGKEKGREEGIEIGKIAIAKTMLAEGESVDKIQKWTGLSLEQINALQ